MTELDKIEALSKIAQTEMPPTRKLEKEERKELYDALSEARKEQIRKFLLEILNNEKDKSYIVKANGGGVPKGMYTYTPETDLLTESESQSRENLQSRNHARWTRKLWLGF